MPKIDEEKFGDNGMRYMTINNGKCNKCEHINEDGQTCEAFSDGIPSVILTGEFDHNEPYPDDNDIQFEKNVNFKG